MTRYASLAEGIDSSGAITASDLYGEIDRQKISTQDFDVMGNAIEQTIIREYWGR